MDLKKFIDQSYKVYFVWMEYASALLLVYIPVTVVLVSSFSISFLYLCIFPISLVPLVKESFCFT